MKVRTRFWVGEVCSTLSFALLAAVYLMAIGLAAVVTTPCAAYVVKHTDYGINWVKEPDPTCKDSK